jgi:putative addiction module killer protein
MIIRQTDIYQKWILKLRNKDAKARIAQRLARLELGLFGDVKSVGNGVFEIRIDCGQGYRIYYIQNGKNIILLLCGGDKNTQSRDIELAKNLTSSI